VLKPQREGGGNNFYHQELCAFLQAHQDDAAVLDGYVLMQRIFPKTQQTAFYRQGKVVLGSSISELGVYGIFLGNGNTDTAGVCLNEYAGYLLRTKAEGVDEGGVATGYSVLNSIYLVDE
jgi:glutathione synthase